MEHGPNKAHDRNKRIIVIGAGISGLRAASKLIQEGLDVVVLEARDRIGGRILTDHEDADNIDMGAAWMHAASYNPLVKLISELKIDYYYDDGSPLFFTEFGPAGPNFKAKNVADEFLDYLDYWIQKNPDVFWSKQNDNLVYFPTPATLDEDSEKNKYPVLAHSFLATNLWIMTGTKKLCILLSPPVVQQIEAMGNNLEELFAYFEPLLELFRTEPDRALSEMVEAKVTSWTMDEFAGYGTYSTARVGDDPRILWDALDENKNLRLQFAGEHCSRTGTGCVHGAYETGEVAAENVLKVVLGGGK